MILSSFDDLLMVQLESLYDAELRLTGALPAIAEAAGCDRLKPAFQEHLHAATNHVHMLEHVLKVIGLDFQRKNCETIRHLLSQAEEVIDAPGGSGLKIAALVVLARRIHHYKIAAYTSLRSLARQSGRHDLVQRLHQAIEAEIGAEGRLAKIAEFSFDRDAACSPA